MSFEKGISLAGSVYVPQLSTEHRAALDRLLGKLRAKSTRNQLRRRYYDYKQTMRSLGLSMPPNIKIDAVLGWPAKAVDAMVRRTVLDSWQTRDPSALADLGVDEILTENRFDTELPAGLTSALLHGVAFGFVTAGDPSDGEPEALITIRSAEWATGTWDSRRRRLSEALSVLSVDSEGDPDAINLYLPNLVIVLRRERWRWDVQQYVHKLGMPVEPLPYRPLLDRPMGSSRISRPVMSLTDAAVRTLARTELSAEFYNAPQRYVLGATEEAFKKNGVNQPGWAILQGHMLTLERDEDGNLPTVSQFPQQSMEPNVSHFRMIAQAYASETSLPLRSLGVVGDNPESADAIAEANKELELELRHWQKSSLTPGLSRLMGHALHIRNGEPVPVVLPHWQRPDTVSLAAATDAVVKLDSVVDGFGASRVGLEMAGLEDAQIAQLEAEQARARGRETLAALTSANTKPSADGSAG